MRSLVFVCLLVVAGAYAVPESDVAPSDARIVDLWILDLIKRFLNLVEERGLDPMKIDRFDYSRSLVEGLAYGEFLVENLNFIGLGDFSIDNLHYNILFGRLDFNFVFSKLQLIVGNFKGFARYSDWQGQIQWNGSLEIEEIRLRGHALLLLQPGAPVHVININVYFTIGQVVSDLTAIWNDRDISCCANTLFNVRIDEWMTTFKYEINTLIGEGIRRGVNWGGWW